MNLLEKVSNIFPYISRDSYFKIKIDGTVVRKSINKVPAFLNFLNYIYGKIDESLYNKLEEYIFFLIRKKYIWEKKEPKKIPRATHEKIEVVKENLFKTMFKSEFNYALKYGQELILRDKISFYEIVRLFSVISDNIEDFFLKTIIVNSSIEITDKIGSRQNYFLPLFNIINVLSLSRKSFDNYVEFFEKKDLYKIDLVKLKSNIAVGFYENSSIYNALFYEYISIAENLVNFDFINSYIYFIYEKYKNKFDLVTEYKCVPTKNEIISKAILESNEDIFLCLNIIKNLP